MEKVTIYKNKGEVFKCHFDIDGASAKETEIRLCLEFQDSPNYFFYGTLQDNGDCEINIPRLKNLEEKSGKLVIEAIAESIYFKIYEADVEFRNSVEVTMQSSIKKTPSVKVKMEEISQSTPTKQEPAVEPIVETPIPRQEPIVRRQETVKEMPVVRKEEVKKPSLTERSFLDYLKAKKSS